MTPEDAHRVLTDARYVREWIRRAKQEALEGLLEASAEQIAERRGIVRGLHMLEHLFLQAEAVLREEEERRRTEEAAGLEIAAIIPPSTIFSFVAPGVPGAKVEHSRDG
jgi:hypothetical protein